MNRSDGDLNVGIHFAVSADYERSGARANPPRQMPVNPHQCFEVGLTGNDCATADKATQITFFDFPSKTFTLRQGSRRRRRLINL
jgi:hypothetical protein